MYHIIKLESLSRDEGKASRVRQCLDHINLLSDPSLSLHKREGNELHG